MVCEECKGQIIMNAFDKGMCKICNKAIISVVTPADKVCAKCSNDSNICRRCGKEVK